MRDGNSDEEETDEHYELDFHHQETYISDLRLIVENRQPAFSAPHAFSHAAHPPKTSFICPRGELRTPELTSTDAGNSKLLDWGNFFCSPFRSPCALNPSSTPVSSPGFIKICAPLLKITPRFQVRRPQGPRLVTPPTIAAMPQYIGSPLLPSWADNEASRSYEAKAATSQSSMSSGRGTRPRPPPASTPIKSPAAAPPLQPLPPSHQPPSTSSRPMSRFYRQSKQSQNLEPVCADLHESRSLSYPAPPASAPADLKQITQHTMTSWALPKLPPLQSLVYGPDGHEPVDPAAGTGRFSFAAAPTFFDVTARLIIDPSSDSMDPSDGPRNQSAASLKSNVVDDLTLRPTIGRLSGHGPLISCNASKMTSRRSTDPFKQHNSNSMLMPILTFGPKTKLPSILSPLRSGSKNQSNMFKGKESTLVTTATAKGRQDLAAAPDFCIVNSLVKKLPPARFDFSAPRELSPSELGSGKFKSGPLRLPQIDTKLLSGTLSRGFEGKENQVPNLVKQSSCRPSQKMLQSILASGPDSDFSFAPLLPPQEHQKTARMLLGSFERSVRRIR